MLLPDYRTAAPLPPLLLAFYKTSSLLSFPFSSSSSFPCTTSDINIPDSTTQYILPTPNHLPIATMQFSTTLLVSLAAAVSGKSSVSASLVRLKAF
jgi:hypothetical protein